MAGEAQRPVLVAVDFSPDADAAFAWALDYARAVGAPLHALHVVHDPAHAPGSYLDELDIGPVQLEEVGRRRMDSWEQRMRAEHPGIDVLAGFQASVVSGLPESRILEMATALGARLIVLGGQGRTALANFLLGSKTERVVRLSRLPVTVVRAAGARGAATEGDG